MTLIKQTLNASKQSFSHLSTVLINKLNKNNHTLQRKNNNNLQPNKLNIKKNNATVKDHSKSNETNKKRPFIGVLILH